MQVAALQNLVKIVSLYYQYMETYMGPALFAVSSGVWVGGGCVCGGVDVYKREIALIIQRVLLYNLSGCAG